ncbi:MAG: 2-C-methyl-D-erythritol 2,4-cyclodiphosphate synthase [bacterium]
MPVGLGFDVHRLETGRPLILGGVCIPFHKGLAGHSDADVLTHALMDALLGAVGEGDIGIHFPDTDPAFLGADSLVLLRQVMDMVKAKGFSLVNIDMIIMAEAPKIAPYVQRMRQSLAQTMNINKEGINIKATTTEGLGFVGRGEGIAAQVVVLLQNSVD